MTSFCREPRSPERRGIFLDLAAGSHQAAFETPLLASSTANHSTVDMSSHVAAVAPTAAVLRSPLPLSRAAHHSPTAQRKHGTPSSLVIGGTQHQNQPTGDVNHVETHHRPRSPENPEHRRWLEAYHQNHQLLFSFWGVYELVTKVCALNISPQGLQLILDDMNVCSGSPHANADPVNGSMEVDVEEPPQPPPFSNHDGGYFFLSAEQFVELMQRISLPSEALAGDRPTGGDRELVREALLQEQGISHQLLLSGDILQSVRRIGGGGGGVAVVVSDTTLSENHEPLFAPAAVEQILSKLFDTKREGQASKTARVMNDGSGTMSSELFASLPPELQDMLRKQREGGTSESDRNSQAHFAMLTGKFASPTKLSLGTTVRKSFMHQLDYSSSPTAGLRRHSTFFSGTPDGTMGGDSLSPRSSVDEDNMDRSALGIGEQQMEVPQATASPPLHHAHGMRSVSLLLDTAEEEASKLKASLDDRGGMLTEKDWRLLQKKAQDEERWQAMLLKRYVSPESQFARRRRTTRLLVESDGTVFTATHTSTAGSSIVCGQWNEANDELDSTTGRLTRRTHDDSSTAVATTPHHSHATEHNGSDYTAPSVTRNQKSSSWLTNAEKKLLLSKRLNTPALHREIERLPEAVIPHLAPAAKKSVLKLRHEVGAVRQTGETRPSTAPLIHLKFGACLSSPNRSVSKKLLDGSADVSWSSVGHNRWLQGGLCL